MKKLLSVFLCAFLMFATTVSFPIQASALTVSEVKTKFDVLMQQSGFKKGDSVDTSLYTNGKECFAFVDLVTRRLFGHGLPSNVASNKYQLIDSYKDNFVQIGNSLTFSSGNLTKESLKSLFSQVVCGDIVQMRYTKFYDNNARSLHTMVVYSVSDTGVVFYHSGRQAKVWFGQSPGSNPLYGTSGNPVTWENLKKYFILSGDGISVYRSRSVTTSSGGSTTPSINHDNAPKRVLQHTSPTMKGDDVVWVQTVLNNLRGSGLDVDGSYGKKTVAAVKEFQMYCGLSVTGICDETTVATMQYLYTQKYCSHTNTVVHATCTKPMHCSYCGVTAGTALGHAYSNACDTSCNTCGATRSVSHSYKSATCTAPKTCTVCGSTSGSKLGHAYSNNCDTSCNTCGATRTVGGHTYSNDADTSCNSCGAFAYPGGNVLYQEGGKYYHVINRQKVNDTLLFKHTDGVWYYVNNGVVDFTKTGLVMFNNGKYFYVQSGKINFSKTGLVRHSDGTWYYIKNGTETNDTLLVKYLDGNWYYVQNGKINFGKTGLVMFNNGKYFYVQSGKINFSKTGLVRHSDGMWYYIKNGTETNDTLLVKYLDGNWYYVQNGKINFGKTGLVMFNNGKYFYVQNGKINFSKTGLVRHSNGTWYYIKNGTETDATLFAKHADGKYYYVQSGKINFAKTGKVYYSGKYYTVKNGVVV